LHILHISIFTANSYNQLQLFPRSFSFSLSDLGFARNFVQLLFFWDRLSFIPLVFLVLLLRFTVAMF